MSDQFFKQPMVYAWQQETWQRLTLRFPDIGHGILLYGKKGAGKKDFALHFVAWLLCLDKKPQAACGVCASCQWLKSNTHPNYVHISTDDDSKQVHAQIKIDKIREIQPFVQQTVEGWRVVLIEPAEALNTAAANALLKTLEEPGERTMIILLTDHLLKLPATIRSRLQRYALDRLSTEEAYTHVSQHAPELNQHQIQLLLNLAYDMPLRALELAPQAWLEQRQALLHDWLSLVKHKNGLVRYANKWAKALSFIELCQMMQYLITDMIALKLNQQIKNIDLNFSDILSYYDLNTLFNISHKLQDAKMYMQQNIQSQLMIDDLFVMLLNL
ncbi:DNA polymerase III subunit delta' [Acinetobacter rathckeae]|uniref:DNA polymerase III subunit delta' n=1 Tax=Acinetobacter rathckeae TaxID=2605272 RepID=UPI0018A25905|nr:DNA polymerase III subunit delta' [Acinetobacter rathckeae]MBF7687652.1 DNA polymerase III subunit delta' [Acinetobacter rathckeae]MBF7695054.1 DNA polymerase III subunit delta' [Acinetobacter rathckeae]